jgi:hypothetical protein
MKPRAFVLPLTLGLALFALPAFAKPSHGSGRRGEDAAQEGKKHEKKFPMPAAEFRAHVTKKTEHARTRMEAAIKKHNVGEEKAKEIRARFEAGLRKLNAEVDKVTADGTVTKDEAKAVRAIAKEMRPHHKKDHGQQPV